MKKWILYISALLYPVWGTIITVYIASQVSGKTGDYVLYCGLFGLLLSAFPFFKIKNAHVLMKIFLSICYFVVASVIIFILGWVSICWFFPSCH